jgi:hypothetical protein
MPKLRLIYPDHTFNFNVNSVSYAYGKIWQAVLKLDNITFVMIYRTL